MPFGYIGQNQTKQQVKNSGVLSSFDISLLEKNGQAGGSFELIEEQTYSSSVSQVIFDEIQEEKYNVHLLIFEKVQGTGDNVQSENIQLFENGVLETSNVYQIAQRNHRATGSFTNQSRTSAANQWSLSVGGGNAANEKLSGYMYMYNAGNSSKFTFATVQSTIWSSDPNMWHKYGGMCLPQASKVDGIKIFPSSGSYSSFKFRLFGVKKI